MMNINENSIVCNGNTAQTNSSSISLSVVKTVETKQEFNLNWLLYTLYARQDFPACKNLIEQQLKENYDHEFLYFIKGLILRNEGNLQDALKCLQISLELNSKNPENYREIGRTLHQMGRLKQALEVFLKAETLLQRSDHEIYYFIGDLLQKNVGKPSMGLSKAKEYFHKSVSNGKQIESYRRLAEIYSKEHNYPKAIEMLESCLSISNDNVESLTEIGVLYIKMNDTQSALVKLQKAVSLDENCSHGLMALGAVLQSRNDIDGALQRYKKIGDYENEGSELWSNIGLCLFKKQKFIAAIACLKKAVWLSPMNFNALYNLGLVFLSAYQYTSAFQVFVAAINIRPENAEAYMLLGICLSKLQDHVNAYLSFERSVMLVDSIKNPLIYLNFSIYCQNIEKFDYSHLYLGHFFRMIETLEVNGEYLRIAKLLKAALPPLEENIKANEEEKEEEESKEETTEEQQQGPEEVEPETNENEPKSIVVAEEPTKQTEVEEVV